MTATKTPGTVAPTAPTAATATTATTAAAATGTLRRRLLGHTAVCAALVAAGTRNVGLAAQVSTTPDAPFTFGFIGDTPYSSLEANALRRVLVAMKSEPLEFVLHVGDIKSSLEDCDNDLLSSRLALLDECPHPLVLTPGDNEWTDCGRLLKPWEPGGRLERLEWLRTHAFERTRTFGRRSMPFARQGPHLPPERAGEAASPKLPENQRWRVGSLQFCTLHVVGSDNAPRRGAALAQAWLLRQQANAEWLNETVQLAIRQKAKGLAIALHANMRFENDRMDGWARMRALVIAAAAAFDGPVLLLHGDTHHFRTDRLLLRSHGLANFRRVECFGSPFSSSWVQVRWDPALARAGAGEASEPFQVSIRALP